MGKRIDLTGQKFGKLTVIEYAGSRTDNCGSTRAYWLCKCDCGNEKVIQGYNLRTRTRDCGCYRIKDLTGKRFGKLTVIKLTHTKKGHAHWLCKCDCGNEKITQCRSLTSSGTISCGCANRSDIINQRFNMLVAIEFSHMNNGASHWKFKCDCGNEKILNSHTVKAGGTKSCGCLRQRPPGHAARKRTLSQWRFNANRSRHKTDLTDEQVLAIHKMNCHYCNRPPSQVAWKPGNNGAYIYTGIDRVNNKEGYTTKNSVPCCWECNEAKGKIPVDIFLNTVKRIAKHQNQGDH